ncbi:DNA-primase RepB domain-containing protein [Sphingopyxis yananensis]|uniref:DNA-primase RepB domain-containing protein n=1 Tax=Sphingopyxis yananensis TaxID=2886687 RepID=UPI001D0F6C9B|nr:DNA-primase RepB domain-containing protein [Sphingopyxis yananensis]MCC2602405.1 RepB family DNA primase [Sphingopyxis yananensis]
MERPSLNGGTLPAENTSSVGKGGKGGGDGDITPFSGFKVSNAEFCEVIFSDRGEGEVGLVASKSGDPQFGSWLPSPMDQVGGLCSPNHNNYFNCSTFVPDADGGLAAKKDQAASYHVLVLDDVGTKANLQLLDGVVPTWKLETSPDNFQVGFKLSPPLHNVAEVEALQKRIVQAGLSDKGAGGMARWMRLPEGINGKEKYRTDGKPFDCKLIEWNPGKAFSVEQLAETLGLSPATPIAQVSVPMTVGTGDRAACHVFQPQASVNPVLSAFIDAGLHKKQLEHGKHDVTCPWVDEHTDRIDTGAVYYEPNDMSDVGGFRCQHSHGDKYHIQQVVEQFGLTIAQAANKPVIRMVPGEMDRIVDAAEQILARQPNVYVSGGSIVKAVYKEDVKDWRLFALGEDELMRILSKAATWEQFNSGKDKWARKDPNGLYVRSLHRSSSFKHLRQVAGLTRQPYFAEDGRLITAAGYDQQTKMLAVFDSADFPTVGTSRDDAERALRVITDLLSEFHFGSETDRAAALAAILTAVVRSSFELAPAFNVTAPASGSGKSYLCEIISGFAGGGEPSRMSYPKSSEEASKAMAAALLSSPAVIEFDDMDSDWIPHGMINRMLTSSSISERLLGHSRTVTVSTRALVIGSGNNIEPLRDLRRRVATINLDTRTAVPGTIAYKVEPVRMLRENRGMYVAAALTIIEAWKANGRPKADIPPIASYNGDWSELCRQPLCWLGLPDPASSLIDQMCVDPESQNLERILGVWYRAYGEQAKTVRAILADMNVVQLHEEFEDLPGQQGGTINRYKLGWYLKKNANRIVGGYSLQAVAMSERKGWKVVKAVKGEVAGTVSPPLPALEPSVGAKTAPAANF